MDALASMLRGGRMRTRGSSNKCHAISLRQSPPLPEPVSAIPLSLSCRCHLAQAPAPASRPRSRADAPECLPV